MNRGKDFEEHFKQQMVNANFDTNRVCDNTAGYVGGRNICDFITYVYPSIFYFELKTTKGNTLPFSNITDTQYSGLIEKEKVKGAGAGLIIWYLERDKTYFVSAGLMQQLRNEGNKSINIKQLMYLIESCKKSESHRCYNCFEIQGVKKRVFFNYDMEKFKQDLEAYINYGK